MVIWDEQGWPSWEWEALPHPLQAQHDPLTGITKIDRRRVPRWGVELVLIQVMHEVFGHHDRAQHIVHDVPGRHLQAVPDLDEVPAIVGDDESDGEAARGVG